jgi:nucleoside-diphosphate kinase
MISILSEQMKGACMEKTLVILKPNAVQRELIGELISKFERRGMKITAMKLTRISPETAEQHYEEHMGKEFYKGLISFITSGPSVIMILESMDAVEIVRSMVGATNPAEAASGTIRGDYATSPGHNMIHASDSIESAKREIELFFRPEEVYEYRLAVRPWL